VLYWKGKVEDVEPIASAPPFLLMALLGRRRHTVLHGSCLPSGTEVSLGSTPSGQLVAYNEAMKCCDPA